MSGKYHGKFGGYKPDELQGDSYEAVTLQNIEVSEGDVIERGMLLASDSPSGTYKIATSADTTKNLVIARDNFIATSESKVTQAYKSGVFNREKIITASSETAPIEIFEMELRRQNIHLSSIKGD